MSEQNELGIAQLELQAAEAKLMRRYREGKRRLIFTTGYREVCRNNPVLNRPYMLWMFRSRLYCIFDKRGEGLSMHSAR